MVFYGEAIDGLSRVLTILNRELEPKLDFNHPSGRDIGVEVVWSNSTLMIFNVYTPNTSKLRKKIWNDLAKIYIEGEWCIMGDFNMVEKRHDS